MNKVTIGLVGVIIILSAAWYMNEQHPPATQYTPKDKPVEQWTGTSPETPVEGKKEGEYTILDFTEIKKFNTSEEMEYYRFEMKTGGGYRICDLEYHYLGNGKMLVKDFGDPEYVLEYRWILQVGVGPAINSYNSPKQFYGTTVVEITVKTVRFRIDKVYERV